ncbi:MAG TPA: tetratricopeptide repeat protein [Acidobacteriaceae bacterium]|nr:tetratricopeptide repeat protein [Acidobacteriaceae bacterium]
MVGAFLLLCPSANAASKLRITIPRRSEMTPVQHFNREGVRAIQKHDYQKAEALFYKAYLYDPADPFTLNNLGYISELEGHLDRAVKFYKLAEEQSCNAVIDMSSSKQLVGKPMVYALGRLHNTPMLINRMNIEAIDLLAHQRAFDAVTVLKRALPIAPQNPFTLNNLGVAEESVGNYSDALKYYQEAAASRSTEPVTVTLNRAWRGKRVSEAAAANANRLRHRMRNVSPATEQANLLTLRGVAAANQNNWKAAQQDFLAAYKLAPENAFTLNNRAYLAEKQGDLETAQFFYWKAKQANGAHVRIGLATSADAEGQSLEGVAEASNQMVGNELHVFSRKQKGLPGPITLTPRNNGTATPKSPNHPLPPLTPEELLQHPSPE